ncbi:unnamed protein product [Orchesella dallaii]|uniref:Uncharacterized protein n=1 Tax=Orchesella dallaii TaxID=48710 RepID=A0ABP1S2Y9_9HEXA
MSMAAHKPILIPYPKRLEKKGHSEYLHRKERVFTSPCHTVSFYEQHSVLDGDATRNKLECTKCFNATLHYRACN